MEHPDQAATPPVVLVVDAANVVGSRPDGRWADRRGATLKLRDHLAELARHGLEVPDVGPAGSRVRPTIVLVAEGQARGLGSAVGIDVVDAPGEGDDTIVDVVRRLVGSASDRAVVVATADRELRRRVLELGATAMSPRAVRHPAGPRSQ